MNVLNKVFMEHITDLMSTGEIEPKILDRNIEISHIKVTPDFKLINVFWIDHNLQESDTEELLKKCTFQLRHELSQLRVIGNVPPVQFVKCKGIAKLKEVERKLNALDFDAEHVSTPYPNDIHHIVTAKILVNNKEIESVKNGSENSFSVSVPMMKHNVFGLDHYRIMTKIKASLNKTRKNRKEQAINVDSKHSSKLNVDKVPSFITEKEQEEQFKEFLVQKRKQQRFMLKKRRSRKNDFIYDLEEQNDNDFYDYTLNNKHDDFDDIQDDDDFDEYVDKEFDKKH
ncbi:uncharacterized protein LOC143425695 [Xylocopa sonorina]|uniref:uncharacterized protein LOC143425695 n=1 Tax=Xylocopa sonorina TaxID=1818115 RepID=UPI00403AF739